jgi:hypothetical protein
MQQPCSSCGYVSDRPARFCRQCGAQIFIETETTSAATRNYDPRRTAQPHPDPQTGSQQMPGFDEQAPETARFYRPPVVQGYPQYQNYPIPTETAPKKSHAGVWILIAFLSLMLVGGGMIGMVGYVLKQNKAVPVAPPDSDGPVAGIPAPPPPPAPAASEEADDELAAREDVPAELQRYVYRNAKVTESVNALGTQVITMTSEDELKKIREFYVKLAGAPMVENSSKGEKTLVFQTAESPTILIAIEQDSDDSGQTRITLTRSPFVPKLK